MKISILKIKLEAENRLENEIKLKFIVWGFINV